MVNDVPPWLGIPYNQYVGAVSRMNDTIIEFTPHEKYMQILTAILNKQRQDETPDDMWRHPDVVANHEMADEALCDLLREIGMGDVADTFDKITKWYE